MALRGSAEFRRYAPDDNIQKCRFRASLIVGQMGQPRLAEVAIRLLTPTARIVHGYGYKS